MSSIDPGQTNRPLASFGLVAGVLLGHFPSANAQFEQLGTEPRPTSVVEFCDGDVCLRDRLAELAGLDWDRVTAGYESLIVAESNPFVGLTDAEYERLQELTATDVAEITRLLAKVRAACRKAELSLGLGVRGRDTVDVTFAIPSNQDDGVRGFQVVRIDHGYHIADTKRQTWLKWVNWRFPGISALETPPAAFANYRLGPFVGTVVLYDTGFTYASYGTAGEDSDCVSP